MCENVQPKLNLQHRCKKSCHRTSEQLKINVNGVLALNGYKYLCVKMLHASIQILVNLGSVCIAVRFLLNSFAQTINGSALVRQ
jgi:hypothetical protein